jgi:hypothetical protein
MENEEIYNMKVIRYRDPKGNPTCALYFKEGKICIFYGTYFFGHKEICWFGRQIPLERGNNGQGFLIPIKECPIWNTTEDK